MWLVAAVLGGTALPVLEVCPSALLEPGSSFSKLLLKEKREERGPQTCRLLQPCREQMPLTDSYVKTTSVCLAFTVLSVTWHVAKVWGPRCPLISYPH